MINDCDGVLGAAMAVEGTEGFYALINGPGGCRSRLQNLLREQIHDYANEDPATCGSCFMSRQSRTPCTFLNPDDMIMGSGEKMTEGLDSVLGIMDRDIVLVETVGASIQVADRQASVDASNDPGRIVLSDADLSSMSFSEGFDDTMLRMVRHIDPPKDVHEPFTVNILGYGIFDSGWEDGRKDLEQLLDLLGVRVVSFIGCGSKDSIMKSGTASACILIHPETSRRTAEYYEKVHGIPIITPAAGSPIGYPSIRSFIQEVAAFFDVSPDSALEKVAASEKELHLRLTNCDRVAVALHGYGMMAEGLPSDVIPIAEFMSDLLGLIPESISVCRTDDSMDLERLQRYLDTAGCAFAFGAPVPGVGLRALFTDGLTARYYKEKQKGSAVIGYMMPFVEKQNFISRSIVGLYGCRYLVDCVINGQDLFFCDQPVGVDFR